jgi:hypothetical protein
MILHGRAGSTALYVVAYVPECQLSRGLDGPHSGKGTRMSIE